MAQEALKLFPNINLVVLGMLIFVSVFSLLLLQVFHGANKIKFDKISQIPLQEETTHE